MNDFPPIEALIAHRENMLLLHAVTAFSETDVRCTAYPDPESWYAHGENQGMPSWIGIELMAQAVAAHVALLAIDQGRPSRPGALLGTRNYVCTTPQFTARAALTVHAREVHRSADGLGSYDCTITSDEGTLLASAALTVYEPADFKQFIFGKQE